MNSLINSIISYLKYLNDDCNLKVSIHFDRHVFERIPSDITTELLPYNCHTNAYCVMTKTIKHGECLLNQTNLLKKCKKDKSFCSVCHAGVYEYIYPVCKEQEAVGFIAVSGYRKGDVSEYGISNATLWECALSGEMPVSLCNCVIPPLCIMIEQMLAVYLKEYGNEYNQILQFLNEYHTNITLSDMAKHFNRSKSHISHLFKSKNGATIRAYCNRLKLEDAKNLLLNTDISITEIALNVGFNDTSYFIHLFKKQFGISPLQYRRTKDT